MKLQRQLSNGCFIGDPDKGLLQAALEFDQRPSYRKKKGLKNIADVVRHLEQGVTLRYGTDWYEEIRCGEAHKQALDALDAEKKRDPNYSAVGWVLDCGCAVHWRNHMMSSSSGSSCPDCYDRMSI